MIFTMACIKIAAFIKLLSLGIGLYFGSLAHELVSILDFYLIVFYLLFIRHLDSTL